MKKLLFVASLFLAPNLFAGAGKVSFHAEGEGLALDINGESSDVAADGLKVDGGKVTAGKFSVAVASFKTGIGERDKHLGETLEASKFPSAEFSPDFPIELKDGGAFSGTLKLHGVEKKVSGKLAVSGKKATFSGSIKLKDFGITPPEYKLAKVSNDVEVKVEINLP